MRFRPIRGGPRFRREDGPDRSVATPGIIGFSQCPRSCQDGLLFPHGVSFESDPVRVVDEAIEDGVRDRGIADGPVPFFNGDLAYDESGFSSVTVLDDFEEVAALLVGKRGDSPVVEDEEIEACEGVEEFGVPAVAAAYAQLFEEPREADVSCRVPFPAGLVPQGTGEGGLAGPGGPRDDQGVMGADPVAAGGCV